MRKHLLSLALLLLSCLQLLSQPGQPSLQLFASGFDEPLFVTNSNDERLFVVEKAGKIHILDEQGVRYPTPFLDISARVSSNTDERGLLGMAFHPDYPQNGYFFVCYTNSAGATVVSRFLRSADPFVSDPSSEVWVLTIPQTFLNHYGGCLQFGKDGYLYISRGDGGGIGDPNNHAQDPQDLRGKILRIDVDHLTPDLLPAYQVPATNPYYGSFSGVDEVWGLGLRNPWRFSFDRVTGDMWIGDVGQDTQEEIDFWPASATTFPNFGWRCYEGTQPYNTAGCQPQNTYDAPLYSYGQTQGNCSVTGGYVYRGARYASLWGHYFHTDFCGGYLWWTSPDGLGGWVTNRSNASFGANDFSSFGVDWNGELYVTGLTSGNIYRLADTTCMPVAHIAGGDTLIACQPLGAIFCYSGPNLTYQWQRDTTDIPFATFSFYSPYQEGYYRVIVSNGSCRDTSRSVYVVFRNPPVASLSFADTMLCFNSLPEIAIVSPPGGYLVGSGIRGDYFDPFYSAIGTHDLVYWYNDPVTGCSAVDSIQMTVTTCVGTMDPALASMQINPNPSDGLVTLTFTTDHALDYTLKVQDLQGRQLHHQKFACSAGPESRQLDLRHLPAGVYFLQVQIGDETKAIRFVLE